ncbi:hypothetical protein OV203_21500 [Nannocystis sp. ILAH1]|uniref:hypothetical protein n=1 Tax=Nannocystis sp. ILAH1 TaxID=2996789 RepID=UPI00226DED02|nr:hypothetical protein [Nannocystis sp. ILAH1]MCY0989727.1 hypothetical protein [Nannocystis sp. ILAH1]
MLHAITDASAISEALAEFYVRLSKGARTRSHVVGYPGGSEEHKLYWHKNPGLWAILEENEDSNRSWNCFGLVDPQTTDKNLDIICEINFPHEGIDRRIAGVFAEDDHGAIHVIHSGRIGGNKGPAARAALMARYTERDRCVDIEWPDGLTTSGIAISPLKSKDLLGNVHEFVDTVARLKTRTDDLAVKAEKAPTSAPVHPEFRPEFEGARAPYTPGTVTAICDHGPVVNALHDALRGLLATSKYTLGSDRHRDLFIARNDKVVALFEAKAGVDLTSLYTAIGQLFYHTAGLTPPPACILVAPGALSPESSTKLDQLGINILKYHMARNRPEFPRLDQFLAQLGLTVTRSSRHSRA